MIVQKHLEKKVSQDYFFIEGLININSEYFINKINEGITREDNLNFKTNIIGEMTSYTYFNEDPYFIEITHNLIDYVDTNLNLKKYRLNESWGFAVQKGGKTVSHDHKSQTWSGAIYLNDHKQALEFPTINQKIVPSVGKFVIFSPFLKHGCLRNNENNIKYGLSFNFK